jgi:hypothetical protein
MGPKKPLRPKRKQGSMDNDLRQFANTMPKQGRNPSPNAPKPRTLTGVEAARAAAKEMAKGQKVRQQPRKKKMGMGY